MVMTKTAIDQQQIISEIDALAAEMHAISILWDDDSEDSPVKNINQRVWREVFYGIACHLERISESVDKL